MYRRSITFLTFALLIVLTIVPVHAAPSTQTTPPSQVTVQVARANLRGGPGTNYAVVGSATAGVVLTVSGCNTGCTWYQLNGSQWIAASIVAPVQASCDPAYPGVCIPSAPPDLDCGDLAVSGFAVLPPDPHGFDADEDGIGCELGNDAPTSEPDAPTAPSITSAPTANSRANLRGGPGTNYPVVGSANEGQALSLIGRNAASTWYQLSSRAWVAAFLVDGAPSNLPEVDIAPVPESPAPERAPDPVTPQPSVGNCDPNYTGACIPIVSYDLDCGDISARRFQSIGSDPHGFDGDNDGLACER